MEGLLKEVWWEIFKYLAFDDLLFVCKAWYNLIDSMPASIIQRYFCQLNGLLGPSGDWRRRMRWKVRRPPRIFYEKLAFNQKILLPNTPLAWVREKDFDRESYVLGYKNRIPWQVIFDWFITTKIAKSLRNFVDTVEKYFTYMYCRYEQYRYHILTTHPVYDTGCDTWALFRRVDPGGEYHSRRSLARPIDCALWDYYSQSRPHARAAIEAEWMRFLSG